MKEQLYKRLVVLKDEQQKGQQLLASLESQAVNLRSNLLRISGAIQVLEEECALAPASPVAMPTADVPVFRSPSPEVAAAVAMAVAEQAQS